MMSSEDEDFLSKDLYEQGCADYRGGEGELKVTNIYPYRSISKSDNLTLHKGIQISTTQGHPGGH